MSESASSVQGNDPAPSNAHPTGTQPGVGSRTTDQPAAPSKPSTGDVYRDAIKRLNAGERPKDINRDVYQGRAAESGDDEGAASQAASESEEHGEQPGQPAAADPGDTRGLSTKELNALKRGKIDIGEAHWKSVPASNIKAIAKGLVESQANADRAFQAAKGGNKPPAGQQQQPGQPQAGAQGQQQTGQLPTDAGDGAAGAADAGNEAPTQEPGNQNVQSTADFFQPLPAMDAKTRSTLVEIGGEGLAAQIEARDQALYTQTMTQFAPMVRGFQAITSMLESRDIADGFADLGKDAAYANLTPDQRKSVEAKASQLLRASDQPIGSYGFRQAIGEAARIVLSTNVSQAAQAKLLTQRTASVRGSPDKGNSRTNASPKSMTAPQLARAVGDLMKTGKSAAEARAMLEGGNAT